MVWILENNGIGALKMPVLSSISVAESLSTVESFWKLSWNVDWSTCLHEYDLLRSITEEIIPSATIVVYGAVGNWDQALSEKW